MYSASMRGKSGSTAWNRRALPRRRELPLGISNAQVTSQPGREVAHQRERDAYDERDQFDREAMCMNWHELGR